MDFKQRYKHKKMRKLSLKRWKKRQEQKEKKCKINEEMLDIIKN